MQLNIVVKMDMCYCTCSNCTTSTEALFPYATKKKDMTCPSCVSHSYNPLAIKFFSDETVNG
ncbi:hypothetical protein WN55_00116 [Dufourea novaeangliae]|uniref:Uncharacterized protein n=1 Tax=Dufourea novaeangliae TaxID=178035 RepID=A0A154NW89_DUFNO|nr:hypothetical protein WN55_00116 [Dufourea novaeangliae]